MRKTSVLGTVVWLGTVCFILITGIIWLLNKQIAPSYPGMYDLAQSSMQLPGQPESYQKSGHVNFDVSGDGSNILINYTFKDHQGSQWEWEWGYPKDTTINMVNKFGIPQSVYQNAQSEGGDAAALNQAIEEGLFKIESGYIVPDRDAIIDYYWDYMSPIANLTSQTLGKNPSFRSRLELILKFTQDIPFGKPPKQFNNRIINGILPPPQLLINMFGDCDSKALLYGGIVAHFNIYDVAFFETPNHLLVGVAGIPKPYDTYYTYKNQKYILANVVGPSRTDLGHIKQSFGRINKVEPLRLN